MNYLIRCFLFFLLVLLSTHRGLSQETPQTPSPSPVPEANPLWQTFGFAEGRFSIQFPGDPEAHKEPVGPAGQIGLYKYSLTTRANYIVTYADYPAKIEGAAEANRVLDDGVKDIVAAFNSQLLSSTETSLGEYPGRQLKHRMIDGAIMHMRIFLVGRRLYKISVTLPRLENETQEEVALYETSATRFLNSFKLPRTLGIERTLQECKTAAYGSGNVENRSASWNQILNGSALSLPKPAYPGIAKASSAQGTTVVEVVIDPTGKVVAAQALSGHPLLYAVSVEAARKARFSPTMLGGVPVCVTGVITYNFVLR